MLNVDFKERIDAMTNQFMRAEEVAKELGISKSFAYKLIRQLNQELREQGYGRITFLFILPLASVYLLMRRLRPLRKCPLK